MTCICDGVRDVYLREEGRAPKYFKSRIFHRTATGQKLAPTSSFKLTIWCVCFLQQARKIVILMLFYQNIPCGRLGILSSHKSKGPRPDFSVKMALQPASRDQRFKMQTVRFQAMALSFVNHVVLAKLFNL